ncbi:centrosomal protein of 162 kDa-like isoform X2 [Mercenaria mercenaria]|uniref:centrosomal protein of 162 kDa-like isoform X2 n=1 Tax=Mercenaria mercenaria TaxID=6596 RepID=UPI00234E3B55|nr:centrosomal protein of 162 kDa-like isoform X2 [Mercenaria mercenaria]
MSRSKRQKDFDQQFEAFLKESLSSEDSINSARINKFLEPPTKEKKPWWDVDDDDDDDKPGLGTSRSFLKKKSPENVSQENKKQDFRIAPKAKARKDAKIRGKAESSISKDSLDDISEKSEEDHGHVHRPRVHVPEESMDSINTEDLLNERDSGTRVGMDTLDEMADKEKFFRDLERNADGTIDYGRLNRDLSATGNTMSPEGAAKTAATLAALQDIEDEVEEDLPTGPDIRGELVHSERDQSEQKPSMLSKVSLMDSLESTMNTTTSPQVGKGTMRDVLEEADEFDDTDQQGENFRPSHSGPETLKTATGLIGTNTSQEIEALHNALEKLGLSATIGNDSQLDLSSQGDKGTEDLVKKLLSTSAGKQRNVAEIMKELEDLQMKVGKEDPHSDQHSPETRASPKSPKGIERQKQVEDDHEELRGFNLSPARPFPVDQDHSQRGDSSYRGDSSHRGGDSSQRGGFDTSHTEDTEMYRPVIEVSEDSYMEARRNVSERGRGKKKEQKKKTDKKREDKGKQHKQMRTTDSSLRRSRSRSSSPMKIDFSETLKWKHKSIKGSGYGQMYSPPKPPWDRSHDRERELLGYSRSRHIQNDSPLKSTDRVTQQTSPKKREVKTAKGSAWSPAEVSKQKMKGSQSAKRAKLGSVASSQLDASVESFAKYIKEHFIPEAKPSMEEPSVSASFKEKVEDNADEEKVRIIEKLKADLESMERSYERQLETQKLQFEQEISELKQENFVLHAKVSGDEGAEMKKKVLAGQSLEGVGKDQLETLQRDLREQETLISGYQQENKRLYDEMKNLKKQSKQVEERMFQENQKLLAEAANLRTQLEQKEEQYRNKGLITGPEAQQRIAAGDSQGAIAHLEAELSQAKRTCDALNREISVLQQSRVELEKHVEKLVLEREHLNKALEQSKTLKSEEARALEQEYQKEIEKLKNKLKWYAENQELLDKGARKLKSRDDEIHKLKMRIEDLQTESGKRVEDSKVRARERAGDQKKIQDLQRQVKEMEAILKRRNPNSLPTLMIAAAAAPDNTANNNRSAYSEVLESRVKKLEKELEEKDGETDKLMRGVEQKYHSIKLQFEERIKELELQLSIYQGQTDHVHPHTHSVALERELESIRERYKHQVKDLQAEIDRLAAELAKSKKSLEVSGKAEIENAKETETELRTLVRSLQQEVENKNHDLQVMQKSLERLRKEKPLSYTNDAGKKGKQKGKGSKSDLTETEELSSLPAEKEYEPKVFEDAHISDVLKENEDLKMKVDKLQLQMDQHRVDIRKVLAENEGIMRETRENYEEKIEQLRRSHQQEVKRLMAQQALEHSTSRMAELQSKVDTQEVMIKHLREQQARLEVEAEAASVLRIKQTRLEESLKSLHKELKEAKKSHTPEMRHFEELQEKITHIETKHAQREQELQQIIKNSKLSASVEIEKETDKWRKLVETKNNEIQRFRMELDSILEVIRVLQKQGVIIPVSSTAVS